jgi:hypothetical protein
MTADELANQYEATRIEGEKRMRERWTFLTAATKHAMVLSGFYSERGQRLQIAPFSSDDSRADVERLEYALGVLKQCVAARVPLRSEKGAPIPRETLTDDVLFSCEEVLFVPAWHDPEFLRLALAAVAAHQEANALAMAGPSSEGTSPALVAVGGLLKLGLVLLMPAALAFGLVAAMGRDVWSAGVAFYVMGAGVLAAMSAKQHEKEKNLDMFERAHLGWSQFRYLRGGGVVGSGARCNLERMAQHGVKVPAVAFDLCAMLEAQMQAAATGATEKSPPRA